MKRLVGLLALCSGSALAQSASPGLSENLVSMGLSLMLVVLLIIGLGIFVKRFNPNLGSSADFKVIKTLPLGSRERLLVIEIDNKQHLLGVTPQSINYLYELETPLETLPTSAFTQELSRFMVGKNKKNPSND